MLIFLELQSGSNLKTTLNIAGLMDAYHNTSLLSAYLDKVMEVYSLEEISGWLI